MKLESSFTLDGTVEYTVHGYELFEGVEQDGVDQVGYVTISDNVKITEDGDTGEPQDYAIWGDSTNDPERYICVPHYGDPREFDGSDLCILYLHDLEVE